MNPDKSIWEYRALRELVGIACAIVLIYLAYRIRATLAPIGAAFLLSYVAEPPVRFLKVRFHIPRAASAALCLIVLTGAITTFWVWAAPRLTQQLNEFIDNLPKYADVLGGYVGLDAKDVDAFVGSLKERDSAGLPRALRLGDVLMPGAQRLFGFVGTVTAASVYAIFASLLVIVFFFLFVTFKGWGEHVFRATPRNHRDAVREVARLADQAVGAYVRGQMLVALFTFATFSVGFFLADVPYWFVVALIGGIFSLVPYGQVLGPIGAVTLKLLESQTGDVTFTWWGVVAAPLVVYAISQSMETWVITPLVQGEINELHPALILTVLILGGAIGGVVGLILAIPVTATVKASMRHFSGNHRREAAGP